MQRRFELSYHYGEDLDKEELAIKIKNKDYKYMKIIDNTGICGDLIVTDEQVAKNYINYLNKDTYQLILNEKIEHITRNIEKIRELNDELLTPVPVYDKDAEEYVISLKETLQYEGYIRRIMGYEKNIFNALNDLKRKLIEWLTDLH